ncbi:MAG TPA: hypothetical protein VMF12_10810 [Xanthobacteraceae bacterium]|nr:hypothetical protein [Xanthobacteraceae bacterium]
MAESITVPPKPKSTRSGSADKDAFAQVEKWMAVIREFSREQPKG